MTNLVSIKNALLAILLTAPIFLMSCGDDDDATPVVANEFTFDGKTYVTTNGFINATDALAPKRFELVLLSENLTKDIVKEGASTSTIGTAVWMLLESTQENELAPGSYDLEIKDSSAIILEADWSTEAGVKSKFVVYKEGSVTIAKEADQYKITYTLSFEDGKQVTGTYTGALSVE